MDNDCYWRKLIYRRKLMNKEYTFKYKITNECLDGYVKYQNKEILFIQNNKNMDRQFSLMIGYGYNDLSISTINNKVVTFNGVNPKKIWKKAKLKLPEYLKGEVYIDNDLESIMDGQWYTETWNTYYDKHNNILCIGEKTIDSSDVFVEVCKNIIICLNGIYLKGIWIIDLKMSK